MDAGDLRFGQSEDDETIHLLAQIDSASTKRRTKAAVQCFILEYMVATNSTINLDSHTVEDMATLDARKKDLNQCKLSALKSMRLGLARHFMNER